MTQRIFTLHEIAERLNRCDTYFEGDDGQLHKGPNAYLLLAGEIAAVFGLDRNRGDEPDKRHFTVPASPPQPNQAEGET